MSVYTKQDSFINWLDGYLSVAEEQGIETIKFSKIREKVNELLKEQESIKVSQPVYRENPVWRQFKDMPKPRSNWEHNAIEKPIAYSDAGTPNSACLFH